MEMSIEGVDVFDHAALPEGVANNNHIAPPSVHVAGEDHNSIPDTINWIFQIGIAPAISVPIFAHVPARTKPACFIVTFRFRLTYRKLKTARQLGGPSPGGPAR